MDNSSRVTVVDSIYQLIKEKFDLVRSNGGLVLGKIFFEIIVQKFEDQVEFLLARYIDNLIQTTLYQIYLTILGWGCNSLRIEISRIAVDGTPSSSFSSLIFLSATVLL